MTGRPGDTGTADAPTHEIHIAEIVLDGFADTDRRDVAEGLRSGLERALAHLELADRFIRDPTHPTLDAGQIEVDSSAPSRASGDAAGGAVARAILGGTKRS